MSGQSKKVATLPTNKQGTTIAVDVFYSSEGVRGYYLRARAVELAVAGMVTNLTAVRLLIAEAGRFSAKRLGSLTSTATVHPEYHDLITQAAEANGVTLERVTGNTAG